MFDSEWYRKFGRLNCLAEGALCELHAGYNWSGFSHGPTDDRRCVARPTTVSPSSKAPPIAAIVDLGVVVVVVVIIIVFAAVFKISKR